MTYNLTLIQGARGLFGLASAANVYSNGYLFSLFLIAFFAVVLMKLIGFGFNRALLAGSFVSFVLSLFFVFAKLMNPIWSLALLVLLAFTVLLQTLWP